MAAPESILALVERFQRNRADYTSSEYNETQTRREFIDPFFKALGWDVDNTSNYSERYKDVVHEDKVRIEGISKAPDYSFRVGGDRKFFVEAKKPSVNLKDDIAPAYQVRRYAWSAKLPVSIVTDFEEFAVYDCRNRPVKSDGIATGRVMYFTFEQYPEVWEQIAAVFSKDAVLKGDFDRYAGEFKTARGTQQVDDAFLAEIERWREELARNLALRNAKLSQRELNFAVQRIIDRIIFLRIGEDRGFEMYGQLQGLAQGEKLYEGLVKLFKRADDRYNSGLFHFRKEAGRSGHPDDLTPHLAMDDKVLKGILSHLYYPDSPYEFSVLPADILGQVYEQFLGKVIRLTEGHRAKVEEKPEVKKAGGVYYTPTYIVDYIVENTVGKLLADKTPRQASRLRILDPACGSGSFLIGAYQYLLDWHLEQYQNSDVKADKGRMVQVGEDDWRLTIEERKRILLNNIYGVDIDSQAVEVTKLSLLLKVLEGEGGSQMEMFQERALPALDDNIKCGNSLIGPDFYAGTQASLFGMDAETRYRINAFDWQTEFKEIMAAGGFNAVIGNPPYVRQELLVEYKDYFSNHFFVHGGMADLYMFFIEKGLSLLNKDGIFCYIVANKWMRANYGKPLQELIRKYRIIEIVDFGDLPVFRKATTYPCILTIQNNKPTELFEGTNIKNLDFQDLKEYVSKNKFELELNRLAATGWTLIDKKTQNLMEKINQVGVHLEKYLENKIFYGIKTGLNEAFIIDETQKSEILEESPHSSALLKPFLAGKDIKRYTSPSSDRYLILIERGWTNKNSNNKDTWHWFSNQHPAIAKHLNKYIKRAQGRYDQGDYWWELRACDYYQEFDKPKIIVPAIANRASYAIDEQSYYSNDKTTILASDSLYLLGILNSKAVDFIMRMIASTKRGGYYEYKPMYMRQLPIRTIDFNNPAEVAQHDRMVALVEQMLGLHKQLAAAATPHEKDSLQRQIDAADGQIDALVYELYGLTEEEIRIVEEAVGR
ncbi:MAG: N-6 DNA methylase [Anaerolineales bacterium]|nr:N-6 DNA methylase [Anaerolineales bacterium]